MGSKSLFLAVMLLAGILGVIASGCYTIIALDSPSAPPEPAPAPILVYTPPPPPPPPFTDVFVPAQQSSSPTPSATIQRTSGPQHDVGRTQTSPTETEQRPVRTGRGR